MMRSAISPRLATRILEKPATSALRRGGLTPRRRTLFQEGADALAALGAAQRRGEGVGGLIEQRRPRRDAARQQQPLGRVMGARRAARDFLQHLRERRFERRLVLAEIMHEADARGLAP